MKFLFSGRVCNQEPTFYYRHYHGRNAWWDNGLDNEFRARVGGKLQYKQTSLSVNFETIQNYVYFAEHQSRNGEENGVLYGVGVKQHGKNLQMLSVGLEQNFQWGIFHWDNQLTYQLTSNQDVMPLPVFNAYTNLYLNFRIANCLKNFTCSISRGICSFPVSRYTFFSSLKYCASSVVGNTFTSPRMPWVEVMTPACSCFSISILLVKKSVSRKIPTYCLFVPSWTRSFS